MAGQRQRKMLESRETLSMEGVYSSFFADSGIPKEVVFELWREVAKTLDLPSGKLRPQDRFDAELGPEPGWEWGDNLAILDRIAAKRLKEMKSHDFELKDIRTLRDYVLLFGRSQRI
jgi:hypothetical protein